MDAEELANSFETFSDENGADLVDLVNQIATVCEDPCEKDMFGDYDGMKHLAAVLNKYPDNRDARQALVRIVPTLCSSAHPVNQNLMRDEGLLTMVVEELSNNTDENFLALLALSSKNDGNKKVIGHAGAIPTLIGCIEAHQSNPTTLINVYSALSSLVNDDDPRQPSCMPSALQNREDISQNKLFDPLRAHIRTTISLHGSGEHAEAVISVVFPLLRDISGHYNKIHALVTEDGTFDEAVRLMKQFFAMDADEGLRACILLLRHIAFSDVPKGTMIWSAEVKEDMKERFIMCEEAVVLVFQVIRRKLDNMVLMEQCFGLLCNLCLRKPNISSILVEKYDALSWAKLVMSREGKNSPIVSRQVVQMMANMSHVPECVDDIHDKAMCDIVREMTSRTRRNPKAWKTTLDVAHRFLVAMREDEDAERLGRHR